MHKERYEVVEAQRSERYGALQSEVNEVVVIFVCDLEVFCYQSMRIYSFYQTQTLTYELCEVKTTSKLNPIDLIDSMNRWTTASKGR